MASISAFVYRPLDDPDNQFRLLHIAPASIGHDETLRATLRAFSREEAPSYRPVSYTWGTEEASSKLLLQDFGEKEWQHFPIRPNLEALLKQFRASLGVEYIWVDAICINQCDNREKGHQVRNMDKIYRNQRVEVWLGELSSDISLAVDMIEQYDIRFGKGSDGLLEPERTRNIIEFCSTISVTSWQSLYKLLCRPWFSRRWIVQEFVLSNHKHFWVGHRNHCFDILGLMAGILNSLPWHVHVRTRTYNYCQLNSAYYHELPNPDLDPIDRFERLWKAQKAFRDGNMSELTLERLLDTFCSFASYDPRDGIYAFISMASDIDVSQWFPDYSDTNKTIHLYAIAAIHIMRITGRSDIICRRAQRHGLVSPGSHSGWVPWFGPQTVNFGSPTPDLEDCLHELHGYNTESLTTFGQPINRSKCEESGWIGCTTCDSCGNRILGNGIKCLDCTDFNYCLSCAKQSDLTHDPKHQFTLHNGKVYHASGETIVTIGPSSCRLCHCSMSDCPPRVDLKGFMVDTLCMNGPKSAAKQLHDGNGWSLRCPLYMWEKMPGMKEHFDENGAPDQMFCRTITGNRMVSGRYVHHVTDSTVETLQSFFSSTRTESDNATLFGESMMMEVSKRDFKISESLKIMLSSQRKFMTTATTFGLFPRESQPGDRIAIILGCSVPVVIREAGVHWGEKVWRLIGECYVDGLMEGEFMEGLNDADTPEDFTLI